MMRLRMLRWLMVVLLGGMCLWVAGCSGGKTVTKHKTKGYQGEARRNPYLAATRFLENECDADVEVRNGFVKYDFLLGTVVAPSETLGSKALVDKMLRWVKYGGTYVCILQRGERRWQDVGEFCNHKTSDWESEEMPAGLQYLLENMGIELVDAPSSTTGGKDYYKDALNPVVLGEELPLVEEVKFTSHGKDFHLLIGGTKQIKLNRPYYYGNIVDTQPDGKTREAHRIVRMNHGNGRIYFITDGRLWRNPYLGMMDHAALLESIQEENPGKFVFGFGRRRGFWSLMINYGWPALLGVLVLLAVWLWKSVPRFGPLLEIPEAHARDHSQTIRNIGHFFWRHKRYKTLLEPLRNEIYRRSGKFNQQGEVDANLIEYLAEASGVPEDQVLEALSRNENVEPAAMVRMTRNLQTILNVI